MIEGENKILQAFLGTLITWGLTAIGAGMCYFFASGCCSAKQKILDFSLGFAAGVMIAASFWSLLAPALDFAEGVGYYGPHGEYAWGPAAVGFVLGGLFVLLSDKCIPHFAKDPAVELAQMSGQNGHANKDFNGVINNSTADYTIDIVQRSQEEKISYEEKVESYNRWKRILLLLIAITIHNIPEGLAVGVAFGAIGSSVEGTFENARNLAIAMGIQNFPEGMAVSIPLCSAGYSPTKAFLFGQLSGVVEPIFGVLGALVMVVAEPLLPYALAFGAGAMIYVVVDNIIPEAQLHGNGRLASWGTMVGFIIMMILDVGLAYI